MTIRATFPKNYSIFIGRTHMWSETTAYKRKCGKEIGKICGPRLGTPRHESDLLMLVASFIRTASFSAPDLHHTRERLVNVAQFDAPDLHHVMSRNFVKLGNISNILRYLCMVYSVHLITKTTSYKRKCDKEIGGIHTPKAVAYHKQSHYCRFMIGHSLGRMGHYCRLMIGHSLVRMGGPNTKAPCTGWQARLPHQTYTNLGNIPNILQYLYGRTHIFSEKPYLIWGVIKLLLCVFQGRKTFA